MEEVEWEPAVSFECLDFQTPLNILSGSDNFWLDERMTRACQEVLHKEVVKILNQDRNLSSKSALIMLFVLGFSDLRMYAVDDAQVETHDSNTDVCAINKTSSRSHHSLNVSNRI